MTVCLTGSAHTTFSRRVASPVPGVGDGVVILYLLPELMPEEVAIDCAPDDLAWLEAAA